MPQSETSPPTASAPSARPASAWAPRILLVLWIAWVLALAWMSRSEWGAPRRIPHPPVLSPKP